MEQFYAMPPQPASVSVKPDKEERRQIRKKYNLVAAVLLVNIVIFNGLAISSELFKDSPVWNSEFFCVAFSCCVPIISEITAIILGIKLLGLDFKPIATRDGFNGWTMFKLITLAVGLQTAASMIAAIITAILKMFGLEAPTPDLSATTSLPANLLMYFYACLFGPVLEELLYRGVLLQSMRKYNEKFAIFLSAVIFGLMHQNYQQFILGFLVGIPLAVVTIKSGSIIPSIFTHIIMNTSAMFFNCWMQYSNSKFYQNAIGKPVDNITTSDMSAADITAVLFRFAVMLAALVVGIIVLVKGGNMSRPTPAGKARTMPVFVTAALWWIVFILYAFINFVAPFIPTAQ
ncbi:MAG: CPBP family intramembrane metalloprotease [Oscillospiraceae bacterium]|nr:CPBP family intramembrane metalloprotease [Oscillospiraceae bacterium]